MAYNDGRYKTSVEGRKAHRILCKDLKLINQVNDKEAGRQYEAGDFKGAAESARSAARAEADAHALGCGWAQ